MLPAPRFDSPACFAALVDTPDAGRWLLAPAPGGTCSSRRYRDDTLVLETEWITPEGRVRVVDFMPPRGHTADLGFGRCADRAVTSPIPRSWPGWQPTEWSAAHAPTTCLAGADR